MRVRLFYIVAIALIFISHINTQKLKAQAAPPKTICSLNGIVTADGEPLPFATITINNTTLGAASDLEGHFEFGHIPEGEFVVKAQAIGYKPIEKTVFFQGGTTETISFNLENDVLGLDQVVVTADRNERKRSEASVIVNTITPKLLENTESICVGEGLNFVPGLRLENNCQNCGFTQVRMNGMDGAHSQILINSRAIFSNLAGVYGLELIPSSMLERIEVTRGGGSALYGSNAVAGTINLITKDPLSNSYEVKTQYSSVGVGLEDTDTKPDFAMNMNATMVSEDKNTGLALFSFYRDKDPFDANDDGYSESSEIDNLTLGARFFHRLDYRSKITLDFIRINEERRGGNKFDLLNHEADISEAVDHKITTGAMTYERFVGTGGLWSVYASAQNVNRDSYYGANQSLSDYGHTSGLTYTIGTQFKTDLNNGSIITGIEMVNDKLEDTKMGYPDYGQPVYDNNGAITGYKHIPNTTVADQTKGVYGVFGQYEHNIGPLKVSAGLRVDHYNIDDQVKSDSGINGDNNGTVVSPRANLLWKINNHLQWRVSYSQGYRAPQIFDEDLHIKTSGSRKVVFENDPDLKQETSHSYMSSVDFNTTIGNWKAGFLAEAFYTKLNDAFVQNPGAPDEQGTVVYYRTNSDNGASVRGINLETNISPRKNIMFKAGYTIQKSSYSDAQEFGEKDFLRTPNDYGFFSLDYDINDKICLIANGNYTGKMKIAYYGNTIPDPEAGELRITDQFFCLSMKAEYALKVSNLPFKLFGGLKNIFNSYQDDFDYGKDRDPGYIYGPICPRTLYVGIKLSNVL